MLRYLPVLLAVILLFGCSPEDQVVGYNPVPTDEKATQYVQEQGLLASVDHFGMNPPGPVLKMVYGKDAEGNEKIVFLRGEPEIEFYGSILMKDGVSREFVSEELAKRSIAPEQVKEMYPIAMPSKGAYAWRVALDDPKHRTLYFDFRSGSYLGESDYQTSIHK